MTEPSKTPRTDALAAKLEDLKVSGDAAALALLVGCRKIESELVDGLSESVDLLSMAEHALTSYQFGNDSPELAEEVVAKLKAHRGAPK
jgi:hypothetical protein